MKTLFKFAAIATLATYAFAQQSCSDSVDCGATGYCKGDECVDRKLGWARCGANDQCLSGECRKYGRKNRCTCEVRSDCKSNQICDTNSNKCVKATCKNNGVRCDDNSEYCNNRGQCKGLKLQGARCSDGIQCLSGVCSGGRKKRCAAGTDPVINVKTNLGYLDACESDDECGSGACLVLADFGFSCACKKSDCTRTGQECGSRGVCDDKPVTPTRVANYAVGSMCNFDTECASGSCDYGRFGNKYCTCVKADDCTGGKICTEGACVAGGASRRV